MAFIAGKQEPHNGSIDKNPPSEVTLTRAGLEKAMIQWAYKMEGPIGGEYILGLVAEGAVLDALARVAHSMERKGASYHHNDVALVWSAWMNYQAFGSPGFPLTTSKDYHKNETVDLSDIEV